MSLSDFLANTLLNLTFRATSYAGQSTIYVKLHIGVPGVAGTSNAAAETTRKSTTFAAAASGAISNAASLNWTNYPADESITHVSLWDAASAGNCLWTGPPNPAGPFVMTTGNTLQIAAGALSVALD